VKIRNFLSLLLLSIFAILAYVQYFWGDEWVYGYGVVHEDTLDRETFELLPGVDRNTFCHGLHKVESKKDNYLAFNPSTSALGRYQFLPKYFREDIQKVTWAQTYEAFLENPLYQEQFMDWYIDATLLPGFQKVVESVDAEVYTYAEVLALVHFLGANGAREFISTNKMNALQQVWNIDASTYLAIVNKSMAAYVSH
jgi:hypothetical protein